MSVYNLCCEFNFRLFVDWVSINDNSIADELTRMEDATDCMLDPKCFCYLDQFGDITMSTDLPALKPNSWTGFAVDTAALVVRQIMHLWFHNWIFYLSCLIWRF